MAIRDAAVRVNMKNAGFLSGLREMGDKVNAAGTRMGKALSKPMKAGISSAKESFSEMMSSAKDHMKTVATLGGGFAIGSFIKDALGDQTTYRNLYNEVSKVSDEFGSWKDLFNVIDPIGDAVGQTGDATASAFKTIFEATGDLKFSKDVLEAVGAAATASGKDINDYANLAQLAFRKYGMSAEDFKANIAAIDAQLGVGGGNLDAMTAKFGLMSTEAVEAGLGGANGMMKLLGAMRAVDNEVGEKAPGAFKSMFVMLKDGTKGLAALEKAAGVKFTPDMDAFDKIKKMLGSEKGRKAMEMSFTGDTRLLFDSLVKPFDAAAKQAKDNGKNSKESVAAGIAAFDAAFSKMGKSSATYAQLQDRVAERMKNDPTLVFQMALEKMSGAFSDPRVFNAIEKLAQKLPIVADYFVKFVDFTANHPLLAMGGMAGAKVGLSFTGGMLSDAGSRVGEAFVKWSGPKLTANAFSAGSVMGGAAKVALVAGAAMAGFEIGKYIAESFWENKEKSEKDAREAEMQGFNAERSGDPKEKADALAAIRENISKLKDQQGGLGEWYENASAALANQIDPSVGYKDTRADQIAKLEAQERSLMDSIKAQEDAHKSGAAASKDAAAKIIEFGNAAAEATKALGGGKPGQGGPPAPLPVTPGHGGI